MNTRSIQFGHCLSLPRKTGSVLAETAVRLAAVVGPDPRLAAQHAVQQRGLVLAPRRVNVPTEFVECIGHLCHLNMYILLLPVTPGLLVSIDTQ